MKFNIDKYKNTKLAHWITQFKKTKFVIWSRNALKIRWVKWSLIVCSVVFLCVLGLYASIYMGAFGKVATKKELSNIKQEAATEVLDRHGKLIGKYFVYDRQPLIFEEIPKHLLDALIATEDVRFFEHDGIDNISLARVFIKNLILQDESAGGGSTITLQLAKNLYGRKHYPVFGIVVNKFRESIIAKRIEEIYSKEEILTMYLNTVPFPDNTYGIESAARKFFNKPTKELSLDEAATLVGTLKANNYFNPRLHPKRCLERRNVVLDQMAKYGYITQDSAKHVIKDTTRLAYRSFNHDVGVAPYFREEVKKELSLILDSIKKPDGQSYNLYKDGLIVQTTLDRNMQILAEEAMKEHLTELQANFEKSFGNYAPWRKDKRVFNAALKGLSSYKFYKEAGLSEKQIQDSLEVEREIEMFRWEGDTVANISVKDSLQHFLKFLNTGMLTIDPESGAVRTYIGGIDYRYFKYDHVSQSKRQVGSTFKPFVYTAAIDDGMEPCTYFPLEAVTYTNFDNWTPTNAGGDTDDPHLNYSLEKALSNSVNTIAVKVLNKVGIPKVIDMAKRLGIDQELPEEPSLALGVAELSIKDITGAFASYVNEGRAVKPFYISKILDRNGNVIAAFESDELKEPAYDEYTGQALLEMMKSTVNSGTASRLRYKYNLRNDIAGKTGTTQDNKDGWFVGITPKLVSVTWVGNDNHGIGFNSTWLGQGANSALPIFAKFYQKLDTDSTYAAITKSKFKVMSYKAIEDLQCEPEKRDGFFERLLRITKKNQKFKGV